MNLWFNYFVKLWIYKLIIFIFVNVNIIIYWIESIRIIIAIIILILWDDCVSFNIVLFSRYWLDLCKVIFVIDRIINNLWLLLMVVSLINSQNGLWLRAIMNYILSIIIDLTIHSADITLFLGSTYCIAANRHNWSE